MLSFLGLNSGDHAAPPLPDIPKLNFERKQDLNDVPRNVKRHCAHSNRMLGKSSHSQDVTNVPLLCCSFCCSKEPRYPHAMPTSRQQQATNTTLSNSLASFLLTDEAKPYCDRPASAPVYLFGCATLRTCGRAVSCLDTMVPQTTSSTSGPAEDDIPAQLSAQLLPTKTITRIAIGLRARPCALQLR